MLYLVIDSYGEMVGRFKSKDRALAYLKERNDDSVLAEITYEEYEEMRKKFLKNP